jgi:flagellar basal body rod protein FlgG
LAEVVNGGKLVALMRHSANKLFGTPARYFNVSFAKSFWTAACTQLHVMDPLTSAAASGLRTRMDSLEMLANNIANANTYAYKADREFYGQYLSADPAADESAVGAMPVIQRVWTDLSNGTLRSTGNPLHLAIGSKAMFAVDTPGGVVYTRDGRVQLSTRGELTTVDGHRLRFGDNPRVQLDPTLPFEVASDGTVNQAGQRLGRLELVTFPEGAAVAKFGRNYLRPGEGVTPRPAVEPEVHQGKLEESNVAAAESAVRLVGVMRQFEALQKALTLGGEMNRRAIEEVARVNG